MFCIKSTNRCKIMIVSEINVCHKFHAPRFKQSNQKYWYLSSLLLEECFLLFPLSFVHCHHCSILLEVWPQACLNPGYHGNLPVQQQTMVHRENHQNHHPFDPYFELKKLSNLFLKVYSSIKNADLLKNSRFLF